MPATLTVETQSKPRLSRWRIALWSIFSVFLCLVVGFTWQPTPFAQTLAVIAIAGALAHAAYMYGWKDALALCAICLAITFTMENIGTATGFPFGHYHFTVAPDLPHVGAIPIVVGPLWFGMGYFSWIVAGTLLGGADRHLNGPMTILALPVVAALVMTQWDLVMDPPQSTIAKAWIWHDGGGHFGVPLSNYLGWLLTSWLFYQAFAVYLTRWRRTPARAIPPGREARLAAILLYACTGLTYLTPLALGRHGEIADAAGHVWRIEDVFEATVAVMLLTMFTTSVLALCRLAAEFPTAANLPSPASHGG